MLNLKILVTYFLFTGDSEIIGGFFSQIAAHVSPSSQLENLWFKRMLCHTDS